MNVYRQLDRRRIQFDFAVHADARGHYDAEIESLGGRIFALPAPASVGIRAYQRALGALLRTHGPFAAVHSHVHHFSGSVLHVAARHGVPVRAAHSHSTSDGRRPTLARRLYHRYMLHHLRRHATHLLGCSRPACESLFGDDCWSDPRVAVVRNALHIDQFADSAKRRVAYRQQLGLSDNALLVGHVGNFHPVKNHAFLLHVFRRLVAERPHAQLVLVGDGPMRAEIEATIRRDGLGELTHLLGVRDDVPSILAALDVFVFPSLYEGLGLAAIEAQAAGSPCVLADTVPADVDLGLGLVQFLSLDAGVDQWVGGVVAAADKPGPAWQDRRDALIRHGYDAKMVAGRLERLYVDGYES